MHIYIFESLQIEASYVGDLYFVTKMLSYIFFSKLYGFTLTIRPMIYLEMTFAYVMTRSLFLHLEFLYVLSQNLRFLFYFVPTCISSYLSSICWKAKQSKSTSFPHCIDWSFLSKIPWPYKFGSISVCSVLFGRFICHP